ncbi:TonB-dependent siderophore receptor [Aquicoccus sp. SCR17]|nr:TonB-dependent siderophore receptor [Carideicomes alvinocaridis]
MRTTQLLSTTAVVCLMAAMPAAAQQDGEVIDLDAISVESESDTTLQQEGYVAEIGRQATKVDTPIALIPQAVSTVTQDQMEDQKPRTVNETLGYTASAVPGNYGLDTRYDAFFLRGFPAYYNGMFRDGLRQYNGPSAWFRNDPYTLEGIAILKGPASSLYGVSGPGGIVNMVSKRPKEQTFREVEALVGTDNRRQLAYDFTGAADEEGRVLYRITGLMRDADTTLEGYRDDKRLIAPALTWNATDRTTITFLGEYSEANVGGTASFYNPSYGVASDIYVGDPEYNDFDQVQWRLGYELEHELTDSVTLVQKLRYAEVDADLQYSGLYDGGGGTLARYWGHYLEDMDVLTVDNQARMIFATGVWDHELVAGMDYTRARYDAWSADGYVSAAATQAMQAPYFGGQDSEQWGLYVHDQVTSGPMTLFGSLRYDWVDNVDTVATGDQTDNHYEALSGRLGVSYQMANGLVPYYNYSTSFAPNVGLVFDNPTDPADEGRPAEPTRAVQNELGLKYQIPGTPSLISAALFRIEQEDGVVFDTSAGANKQRQLDMTSTGIELEAATEFDSGLSLMASYTHLRVEIDKGVTGAEGKELSGTPNDVASIWAHYAPKGGALKGWGFGMGLRYVGESWGDDTNTIRNDDRIFVDAALSYDFAEAGYPGLTLQANVKNLFDKTKQTCTAGYCYRDEGRTATVSMGYRF